MLGLSCGSFYVAIDGIKKGRVAGHWTPIDRSRSPIFFWFCVICHLTMGVIVGSFFLYALFAYVLH